MAVACRYASSAQPRGLLARISATKVVPDYLSGNSPAHGTKDLATAGSNEDPELLHEHVWLASSICSFLDSTLLQEQGEKPIRYLG